MSRADLLSNPHLAQKLAKAQAELAGTVACRPGSHPHPRRLKKQAQYVDAIPEELSHGKKPKRKQGHARSRVKKDSVSKKRRSSAETIDSRSTVNAKGGEADAERAVYSGEEINEAGS